MIMKPGATALARGAKIAAGLLGPHTVDHGGAGADDGGGCRKESRGRAPQEVA